MQHKPKARTRNGHSKEAEFEKLLRLAEKAQRPKKNRRRKPKQLQLIWS
jgi:hypothetical protein